jgi:formylmethanofuran dehydrogenase subunit E
MKGIFTIFLVIISSMNISKLKAQVEEPGHNHDTDRSIVFRNFPVNPGEYAEDVAPYVVEMIHRWGEEEFRLGVITNELHGHLGIYAIIGTKMGLKAREYFGTGPDHLQVVSYAGQKPPLSCMNDGIQVSTGATLGHGLISISDSPDKLPQADFSFKGKTIRIKLKEEYREQFKNDISGIIKDVGLDSPDYWLRVRQQAIYYWRQLDREKIFDIEEL